jgi:hypothetical protein
MGNRYSVQQGDGRGFEEELVRLWSTSFAETSPSAARAKIDHWYAKNPAGPALVFTVHAAGEAAPVGVQSLLPRAYEYQGHSLRVGSYVDFAVNAGHRTLGPAMMLFRRSTEIGIASFDFLHGSPNALAQPALKRAGVHVIGSTCVYEKVQRSAPYMKRVMPPLAASVVARLVDAAILCLDVLRHFRIAVRLKWREVSASDSAFDRIWEGHPDNLLLARRTTDILDWRYPIANASVQRRVWLASDANDSPQGYVVWQQIDGFAVVSDFFCRMPETSTRALLVSFCRELHRHASINVVSVSFFGSDQVSRQIRAAGFWPRREGQAIVVKAMNPAAVAPFSAWYFTPFDLDAD